jgi:hypothetical protein
MAEDSGRENARRKANAPPPVFSLFLFFFPATVPPVLPCLRLAAARGAERRKASEQPCLRAWRIPCDRDARLAALHLWRFLSPGPRFSGRLLRFPGRVPFQQCSLRSVSSAGGAGSRSFPEAMRARHDPRAPHQTAGSRPSAIDGGWWAVRPRGRISGPNPTGLGPEDPPPALHRSAPPQDASRSAPHERG